MVIWGDADTYSIMTQTIIEILKAGCGDCLFITIKNDDEIYRILVDGGVSATYVDLKCGYPMPGDLKSKLISLKSKHEHIDLLIITHIDDDHIGGLLEWFSHDFPDKSLVREVWFNDNILVPSYQSTNNSKENAISLKCLLDEHGVSYKNGITQGQAYLYNWGKIIVLSPNVKYHNKIAKALQTTLDQRYVTDNSGSDNYRISIDELMGRKWKIKLSDANKASIAFLLATIDGENNLLLGDADINTIIHSIEELGYSKDNKLMCELIKLSHHGSKNNYTDKLLEIVATKNFGVSTDGSIYGHPDKEVIAHLIRKTNSNILFNYDSVLQRLFTVEDLATYPMIKSRCKLFTNNDLH